MQDFIAKVQSFKLPKDRPIDPNRFRSFVNSDEQVLYSDWRYTSRDIPRDRQIAMISLIAGLVLLSMATRLFSGPVQFLICSFLILVAIASGLYLYLCPQPTNAFYVVTDKRILLFAVDEKFDCVIEDGSIWINDIGVVSFNGIRKGSGDLVLEPKKLGLSQLWKEQPKRIELLRIKHPGPVFEYIKNKVGS